MAHRGNLDAKTPSRRPLVDLAPSPKSLAVRALALVEDMSSLLISQSQPTTPHKSILHTEPIDRSAHSPIRKTEDASLNTPPATPSQDSSSTTSLRSSRVGLNNIDLALTRPVPLGVDAQPLDSSSISQQHDAPSTSVSLPPSVFIYDSFPNLLTYVDNILMRDRMRHNNPPDQNSVCPLCNHIYNQAPVATTFLPVSPCGCWMHYRCFIWHATRESLGCDACPTCKTRLFQHEGITAITLATRTNIEMPNRDFEKPRWFIDAHTGMLVNSHVTTYLAECAHIEAIVERRFFAELREDSRFTDSSPDLTKCFYLIMDDLRSQERVRSAWLEWNTETGYMLYAMLVALKMRRFLVEHHGKIVSTEGWRQFEEGRLILQQKIMVAVHGKWEQRENGTAQPPSNGDKEGKPELKIEEKSAHVDNAPGTEISA